TAAAGGRDIAPRRAAARIFTAQDLVRAVTARTARRHQQSVLGEGESMNGVYIERIDFRNAVFFGKFCIPVARSAGARQVQRIDGRLGVLRRQDCVRIAVAPLARLLAHLRVNASNDSRFRIRMTGFTSYFAGIIRVWIALYFSVAV